MNTKTPYIENFEDPAVDPYPEIVIEQYQMYEEDGLRPEDIFGTQREGYAKYLEAKRLSSVLKANPYRDAKGKWTTKALAVITTTMDRDMAKQMEWLTERAKENGKATVDDLIAEDFELFLSFGKKWRQHHAFKADRPDLWELIQKENPYRAENGEFTTKEKAWTKTGSNLGSNPGGTYMHGTDKKYVKFPNAKGQILAEAAADRVHELMGVGTMNHQPVEVNGKLASVSSWKDVKQFGQSGWKTLTPEQVQQTANAFVASALVMNWDVVGMTHDNMGTDASGKVHIMDTGGSFQFRAQGEPKAFTGDATPELKAMVNPEKTSGRVYGPLMAKHREKFVAAAQKLKDLPDAQLLEAVKGLGVDKEILSRKASILKHFGL
jgi:hypothetical protein